MHQTNPWTIDISALIFAAMAIVMMMGLLALGIVTTLAGWRMMQLKSHGLAVFASIVALLPCQPVALLGLVFGIWSLIVLSRKHVKAAFDAS